MIKKILKTNFFYLSIVLTLYLYGFIATQSKIYSIVMWDVRIILIFFIYTIGLWHAALVYEASVNETFKIMSMKFIERIFDVDEYFDSKKRILDCIFCHFANVATTGLILMIVIYSTKDFYATLHTDIVRFIGITFIVPAFYAYSLFFLRLMKGLSRFNKKIIIPISAIVFLIDMQSITIFIKSTPAIEIQKPQNNLTKT